MAAAFAEFTDKVDERDAAADPVGIGALGGGERRKFARAVDDRGEPLLRVGDDGEGVGELKLFLGESHGAKRGAMALAGKREARMPPAKTRGRRDGRMDGAVAVHSRLQRGKN